MAQRIGRAADIRRNALEAAMLMATGPEREAAIAWLIGTMNANPVRPTLPLTYVPPEARGNALMRGTQ